MRWGRAEIRERLLRQLAPAPHRVGMTFTLDGLARRGFAPGVVYDVGAARGEWTALAHATWPAARFVLIEPLARGDRARALGDLRSAPHVLRVLEAAVGSEVGTATLSAGRDLDASSFAYDAGGESVEVPVTTLDALQEGAEPLPAPDLLKLDVQGFELEVLRGGEQAARHAEVIILEARLFDPKLPRVEVIVPELRERGFTLYEIADVLRRPSDGAMAECDLVFVRDGSPLLAPRAFH